MSVEPVQVEPVDAGTAEPTQTQPEQTQPEQTQPARTKRVRARAGKTKAKKKPAKPPAAAVVECRHLSLLGPEGPVFTDVSLTVRPGLLTVLVGPGGSGRSSLLLALCGRMRGCTGEVDAQGRPVRSRRDLRSLRRMASVARISAVVRPEARLTVAEAIVERALLDGVRAADAELAFAAAEELLDTHLDRATVAERLSAYERSVLAVALALVRPADLVVLDDLDADLDLHDQRRLAVALVRLAEAGPAVLASTTELTSVPTQAVPVLAAPPKAP